MFTLVTFVILVFVNITQGQNHLQYTEEDLYVIKGFVDALHINSIIFVINEENCSRIHFLKSNVFSVVVNSDQLDVVLNDERARNDFFTTSTMIVSKEDLNYTSIFERLLEKDSTAWITFANPLQSFQHVYIPINVHFYTVEYTPHNIITNQAYHIKPDLNITLKSTGIWQRGVNHTISIHKNMKLNFEEATLDMLHYLNDECINKEPVLYLNRVECFHQEIIEIVADKLNYRIRKKPCQEKLYPYNYPNGTLSDFFVMLQRREVDLSSGSYIITNERLKNYDFAWPIFSTKSMLYIKHKKRSKWRGYLRPFHRHLWEAIIYWITAIAILMQLFQECHENTFSLRLSLLIDFVKSLFTSLQVFCTQDLHGIPKWTSSRILLMMTFTLFLILYQVYSGFLISFLMIDVPNVPFKDMDGFFQNKMYKIVTLKAGFHNYYTNVRKRLVVTEQNAFVLLCLNLEALNFRKKIIKERRKNHTTFKLPFEQLPVFVEEGIKLLCTRKRLTYIEFRENIVMHEIPCRITELPNPMLHQSIGIGFPKNSPYREALNREIISLNAVGILQRMRKRLLSYRSLKEKETSNEEYEPVTFKHIVSIFFILGSGMGIAWGIFFLEHLFNLLMKLKVLILKRFTTPKIKPKEWYSKTRSVLFTRYRYRAKCNLYKNR